MSKFAMQLDYVLFHCLGGSDSNPHSKVEYVWACAQRTSAAMHELLRRDRSDGLTSPACILAAKPVLLRTLL